MNQHVIWKDWKQLSVALIWTVLGKLGPGQSSPGHSGTRLSVFWGGQLGHYLNCLKWRGAGDFVSNANQSTQFCETESNCHNSMKLVGVYPPTSISTHQCTHLPCCPSSHCSDTIQLLESPIPLSSSSSVTKKRCNFSGQNRSTGIERVMIRIFITIN